MMFLKQHLPNLECIVKQFISSFDFLQACQFLRIITFYSTQLPGPNYHCREVYKLVPSPVDELHEIKKSLDSFFKYSTISSCNSSLSSVFVLNHVGFEACHAASS